MKSEHTDWIRRAAWAALFLYLGFRCALWVGYAARVIAYPFEICAGEGILLNQGRLLAAGRMIYRPINKPPFLISHFPLVEPLLLATAYKAWGLAYWPGRLASLLAALSIAGAMGWLARRTSGCAAAGFAAAMLFSVSPWMKLASVELCADTLAAAFGAWGFALAVGGRRPAAGALFALATLTRQSEVAGLAAACGWLWFRDRRAAWRVAGAWAALCAAAVLALQAATGGEFLKHIVVYTAGDLSVRRLWLFLRAYAASHAALLALAGAFVAARARRRADSPLLWFLAASYALAATCARQGSGQTYFIDAIAASCAAAGVALAGVMRHLKSKSLAPLAFTAALTVSLETSRRSPWESAPPTRAHVRNAAALLTQLKRLGPPFLSEYNGLVLQAGGELWFQPYAFHMLALRKKWSDAPVVDAVRRRRFHAIVLDAVRRGRLTPAVYAAIHACYREVGRYRLYRHIGETRVRLLVPRANSKER